MYESKEKTKEEPASGKAAPSDRTEDAPKASEGTVKLCGGTAARVSAEGQHMSAHQPARSCCKSLGKTQVTPTTILCQ